MTNKKNNDKIIDETKTEEVKEVKIIERRTFQIGVLSFKENVLESESDTRMSDLEVNNCTYRTEINYNESRSRYHAIIRKNDKTTSLSFFDNRKNAFKSILMTICGMYRIKINNVPIDILRGV